MLHAHRTAVHGKQRAGILHVPNDPGFPPTIHKLTSYNRRSEPWHAAAMVLTNAMLETERTQVQFCHSFHCAAKVALLNLPLIYPEMEFRSCKC